MKNSLLENDLLKPTSGTGIFLLNNSVKKYETIVFSNGLRKKRWYNYINDPVMESELEKKFGDIGGGGDIGLDDGFGYYETVSGLGNKYSQKPDNMNIFEHNVYVQNLLTKKKKGGWSIYVPTRWETKDGRKYKSRELKLLSELYRLIIKRLKPYIKKIITFKYDGNVELGYTIYLKSGKYVLDNEVIGNSNSVEMEVIPKPGAEIAGFFHTHDGPEGFSGEDFWALFNYLLNIADDTPGAIKNGFMLVLANATGIHTLLVEDYHEFLQKIMEELELVKFTEEEFITNFEHWCSLHPEEVYKLFTEIGLSYIFENY